MKENMKIENIGGQAIMEGVMIRSPNSVAMAVLRKNGKIVIRSERIKSHKDNSIWKKPFLRGMAVLWSSLAIGIRAINFSAKIYDEELRKEIEEKKNKRKPRSEKISKKKNNEKTGLKWYEFTLSVVIAIGMVIVLYKALPLAAAGFFKNLSPVFGGTIIFNLIDALVKTLILIFVMWSMSLLKDVKRLYEYHGAEHMAIFAYEADKTLDVKNASKFGTLHPRCGTNFLIMVFIISIFFFLAINPELPYIWKLIPRLLLLPLIAGVTYELIRFGAKRMDKPFFKILMAPGLWLQKITTRKPDRKQIEVAIEAVKAVMEREANKSEKTITIEIASSEA